MHFDVIYCCQFQNCNLVATVDSLCPITAAVARNTRVWVEARDSLWSVVTIQAALAVHPGCFIPAVEANTSSRELPSRVQASHFPLHLRVEVALVGVTKALTHLAVVPRYELAGAPSLLVEHGAAGVAEGAASVVTTLALIITSPCHRAV